MSRHRAAILRQYGLYRVFNIFAAPDEEEADHANASRESYKAYLREERATTDRDSKP